MPSSGISLVSLVIGLYYGAGFLLWLSLAESRSFANAIFETSAALVIASLGYFVLRGTGAWNSSFTLLALVSIVSTGFFFKRKFSSLEAEAHPLFKEAFDQKTLCTLVLVFSLSLVAQINYVAQANTDSRAIGMLLVGSILALVSRLPKSAKSPVVIFTAVAITLCLSLFATAVLTQGSMVIAESAAMMAFWTVFILLLSLSATPPPGPITSLYFTLKGLAVSFRFFLRDRYRQSHFPLHRVHRQRNALDHRSPRACFNTCSSFLLHRLDVKTVPGQDL